MPELFAGSALPRRPFGRTGLHVTPLCLGCSPLASMPDLYYPVPEEQALAVLRAMFGSPINFLDTAAAYGDGESERRIGLALRELGGLPADHVLATKADQDFATGDFSGEQTKRSVERSLRLLGLDQLQAVYIHDPEYAQTSFREMVGPGGTLEVLQRYKEQGVIGAIGVAGGPIDLMTQYVELGVLDVVLTHNRYTLLDRSAEPLIELATRQGIAVLNAAPYSGGMLAKGPGRWAKYLYHDAPQEIVERVRAMERACDGFGVPLAAAALQFSLRDPRITSTIVGMTRPERVEQTLALASLAIPDDLWQRLDEIGGFATRADDRDTDTTANNNASR